MPLIMFLIPQQITQQMLRISCATLSAAPYKEAEPIMHGAQQFFKGLAMNGLTKHELTQLPKGG